MAILKHLLNTQDITSILSLSAIALMVYYLITFYKHIKKLPPGPWGYPILGQIKSINMEFHLFLLEQMKKFGKVISLKMGNSTLVVLSDYKLIKKAFGSKDFTARPKTGLSDFLGGYGKGHWPVHANVLERFFRNFATQLSRIFTSFQHVMTNVTKNLIFCRCDQCWGWPMEISETLPITSEIGYETLGPGYVSDWDANWTRSSFAFGHYVQRTPFCSFQSGQFSQLCSV